MFSSYERDVKLSYNYREIQINFNIAYALSTCEVSKIYRPKIYHDIESSTLPINHTSSKIILKLRIISNRLKLGRARLILKPHLS